MPLRRIIIATDGSATANRAIDAGASLAKATGEKLLFKGGDFARTDVASAIEG